MSTLSNSLRIGVLRGGPSSQYDLSLQSGADILNILSETHSPIDIFISKDGKWYVSGVEKSPERILKNVDVVWNSLHGSYGEDGGVQEVLNRYNVPYTGSDRIPSAFAINKHLTKEKLASVGVKTPIYKIVKQTDNLTLKAKEIWGEIPHPMIVKPTCGGRSLGIVVANSFQELLSAMEEILSEHGSLIVEEYIKGKDATCGVIDNFRNKEIYTLPPVEIVSPNKFLDYGAKHNNKSREIYPGNFSTKEKQEIERMAALAHKTLGLRHYSNSDFVVSPRRGVYFLETNTLPHMTKQSLLPKALSSIGVSIKDFVHHVIDLAMHRSGIWP
jgi:D-alanine-D-alanine ligase